jgi:uncharacterized protein (TIGR03435 family)
MMQRVVLDRPVQDQTRLSGRYDFDLGWTHRPPENPESTKPDLLGAVQQQLGPRLEAKRGPVDVLVIDQAERRSDN